MSSATTDQQRKARFVAGWIAIGLSTLFTCLWTYWGITENFYEGWYYHEPGQNLLLMLNYLMWALIFGGLSLVSVRWSRIGAVLYGLAGIGAVIYYSRLLWFSLRQRSIRDWIQQLIPISQNLFGVIGYKFGVIR